MKLKIFVSYVIVLAINLLFSYKYLSRITARALPISLFYIIILWLLLNRSYFIKIRNNFLYYFYFLFVLLIALFAHYYVDIEKLNVDRWSVIDAFFSKLVTGEYPYFAKSNMGNPPGPMPTYFMISYPFYLTGFYSLLSALGYLFFVKYIKMQSANHLKELLVLLLMSPFLYWEIITRSNLFTFSAMVLFALIIYQKKRINTLLSVFILGLVLATRSIFILAYIVLFVAIFKHKELTFRQFFQQGIVAFLGFIVVFIPLIIVFPNDIMKMNPFIVQSSFLIPGIYIIIFISIATIFGFFAKNNIDVIYYSGLSLFVAILIYFAYHIFRVGFHQAFFSSVADISYFIFAIPFLLYYIYGAKKA